jgi:3-oxoadipate enol-lactonase
MMTVSSWAYQTNFFRKRYKCILHDARGQLMSEKPEMNYSMEIHASDFEGLLDELGIEKCHIVGISYGGVIGMVFSYTYPERVRSLSVISSLSYVNNLTSVQLQSWNHVATQCPECLYKVATGSVFSNRFRMNNPNFFEESESLINKLPPDYFEAFARLALSAQQINITEKIKDIQCPSLVICGENDILLPVEYSRVIADSIPNSEFITIPNAGHAVVLEKPDEINTVLYGFIEKNRLHPTLSETVVDAARNAANRALYLPRR